MVGRKLCSNFMSLSTIGKLKLQFVIIVSVGWVVPPIFIIIRDNTDYLAGYNARFAYFYVSNGFAKCLNRDWVLWYGYIFVTALYWYEGDVINLEHGAFTIFYRVVYTFSDLGVGQVAFFRTTFRQATPYARRVYLVMYAWSIGIYSPISSKVYSCSMSWATKLS